MTLLILAMVIVYFTFLLTSFLKEAYSGKPPPLTAIISGGCGCLMGSLILLLVVLFFSILFNWRWE